MKIPRWSGWRLALIPSAIFAASTTFAQEAVRAPMIAPVPTETAETERVVVTGSYIPIPAVTRIAFSSSRHGNFEIFSMNPNGSGVTRLTNESASDTSPHW